MASNVPQSRASIRVTQPGLTLGGAVRREGDTFSADRVYPDLYELIASGQFPGAEVVEAPLLPEPIQVAPIAVATDGMGRPVYIPGDRRASQGTLVQVHPAAPQPRTAAHLARTVGEEAMLEMAGESDPELVNAVRESDAANQAVADASGEAEDALRAAGGTTNVTHAQVMDAIAAAAAQTAVNDADAEPEGEAEGESTPASGSRRKDR